MLLVNKTNQGTQSLPAREISPGDAKTVSSKLAQKILKELSSGESYAMKLARKLKVNEQKVYYHIRNLEKARIIKQTRVETTQGAKTTWYGLTQPAFYMAFKDFKDSPSLGEGGSDTASFLSPFIEDGQLNATIIVGSPDPHGPQMARSRDGYYGMDLALFLGTYLHYVPDLRVKLDTEVRDSDLDSNLILIGGPVVNAVTARVNKGLPVRFDLKEGNSIYSTLSKEHYFSDEIGIIVKAKNPFSPKKSILLVAGRRYSGTRAVMVAFMKQFSEVVSGNKHDPKVAARIVEGIDLNSDGVVDSVRFLE